MKLTYTSVFSFLRVAVAGTLVIAAVAMALIATKTSTPPTASTTPAFVFKKGDPDMMPGGNKRAVFAGGNEYRSATYTPGIEAYLIRAYPADEVPMEATMNAVKGFKDMDAKPHSPGSWKQIGPTESMVPGVLNVLGDNAPYITAGRTTGLALGKCDEEDKCVLYLAAAGGGIWRTKKALGDDAKWEFVSGSFGTNAIGTLIVDPTDSSGKTVYAGTGEPHTSVDSEAGVGIYKSTNGGDTWTHLASMVTALTTPGNGTYTGDAFAGRAISSIVVDPTNPMILYVSSTRGVRGYSSVPGGATTNPPTPRPPFGLFKSTDGGANFTFIWDGNASIRGVIRTRLDPTNPSIIYASALNQGTWRSTDGGTTFSLIQARLSANDPDRPEFAVTKLPNGKTRMYLGEGVAGAPPARFFRSDNADDAVPVFTDMTTAQNIDYCTGQCWYDNFVYTPPGNPDVVYLLGSFSYSQIVAFGSGKSNARAVLLSTDGGATWSDLTQDGRSPRANFTHPDQHAIVTHPNNPFLYWEGSDGGVVRSDGKFSDVSAKCDTRGLSVADTAYCKSLLFRVPNRLSNKFNEGLSTLQYQSLSVSTQKPDKKVQGGTQDNGTWNYKNFKDDAVEEIYGDGGQSGFNAANDNLRFNTFTGQANDANFQDGDPTKWVIISAPILSSPEGSYFYPPIIADPNPANSGSIFQGSFSVWRTQDWGGNQAYLEANCQEFTESAVKPGCGDFVKIGNGVPSTSLTSGAWGTRAGGAVAAIERSSTNGGTLWAATGTGRVFFSANGNDPAASVVWERLDLPSTTDPNRFVTGIAIDPANPNHTWISYSGYNFNTPAQPGHVFEVLRTAPSTATWTDVSYNLPDLPATKVVLDSVTGDLYAASDFGVMKLPFGTTTWVVAGTGLPMVEVPGLTIVPSARLLYAATHGRCAYVMRLSGGHDD